ncbi:GNAT family N-acetyltransferase [Microbacterium sp. B35-30]|uniref:GNAT family N-acetyltransferase n=1 Tax=Microbacterium sp. B35-30 TaxID=1962642 RepID=UPI0013D2B366|nr:GNAT family N-acetyltransferase [Microbacterium sp. B35-30]KAF2420688.1 GNAT family N-acetyltransferase [Microbacterium sp. B35-30]
MATAEVRRATVDDAERVAALLHDFNTEFDTDSPGPVLLAERLRGLLAGAQTFALLSGDPAVGIALVTLRPNVWYEGPVALLDEMYVAPQARGAGIGGAIVDRLIADCLRDGVSAIEINVDEGDVDAQRFYARHGFHGSDPDTDERALYFFQEL